MEFRFQSGDELVTVRLEETAGGYRATIGEREYPVVLLRAQAGEISFRLGGETTTARVAADGDRRWVSIGGQMFVLARPAPAARRGRARPGQSHAAEVEALRADMPGLVRSVSAVEGENVQAGSTLMVLEAMKMEIRVTAPHPARVKKLLVGEGDVVERGQTLAELSEPTYL
jgi:3-methylcrotonyl-CoA carboxylase alpha subunit